MTFREYDLVVYKIGMVGKMGSDTHNDARYEGFLLVQKNLLLFTNQVGRVIIKREESQIKLH